MSRHAAVFYLVCGKPLRPREYRDQKKITGTRKKKQEQSKRVADSEIGKSPT